jgi:hypothetical protein
MIQIKKIRYIASVDDFTDVVINLDWQYSSEGFQSISGTLALPLPTSNTFIPIEDLDNDIMVDWVRNLVNPASFQLLPIIYNENQIKEIIINN